MKNEIRNNAAEMIGDTPLVKINRLCSGGAEVLVKMEGNNPLGSVKDRIGLSMINAAEKSGQLKPGGQIIEATSGNTGIALAFIGAARGYQVTLTMPESMSLERRAVLRALGATIVLTPAAGGMGGAIAKAEALATANPNAFVPLQFSNPANPDAHYRTTGPEIWRDTGGRIDALISGVGTGGTLTGTTRYLREKNPALVTVAVEPSESAVISGAGPGPHKIQGIGAGFIPDNLDTDLVSEIFLVSGEESMEMARSAAQKEGIFVGISSGAALCAAIDLAGRDGWSDKRIVAILPSHGERYLSSDLFKQYAS